jgi:hypothetical protein
VGANSARTVISGPDKETQPVRQNGIAGYLENKQLFKVRNIFKRIILSFFCRISLLAA